jgi:TetR/AcrR family transcriptional regulator, cholesterol catabolism regulator
MARTPRVVEDRREQIIDAAMRVFAQKGFARATNKDIAREAGITPGLIYYYFESKEAVFKAIIEQRSPLRLMATVSAEMLAMPPETFLRLLLQQLLGIVESEQFMGLIRVLLPEVMHDMHSADSQIVQTAHGAFQRIGIFLSNYLEMKIESGELRHCDVSSTAQLLISNMIGFVLRRQILRDPAVLVLTHEQIANVIATTVVNGIGQH